MAWGWTQKRMLGLMLLSPLVACGTDLGECYPEQLGGTGTMVHTGQGIVGTSCAGGRCHSEGATGETRFGAPAELNFDVVLASDTPEQQAIVGRGGTNVVDWADQMWEQIEGGTMPPPKPGGPGELDAVQKEAVRNWLACGAEVLRPPVTVQPTWESIWPRLGNCRSCHTTASAVGGNFMLGGETDLCGSYAAIFEQVSVGTACASSGATLVDAMNPTGSLFLQKLNNTQTCGDAMPYPGTRPFIQDAPDVVAAIEMWIQSGAPKPASCP